MHRAGFPKSGHYHIEYYDAKNTYTKALSEHLQAKYNYLFKLRILEYYMGK